MISKILTIIDIILSQIIFWISCLMPKDKNTWIYIGWHATPTGEIFADNTKYLFLHNSQNFPTMTHVWISKEKKLAQSLRENGYKSYYQHSLLGAWFSMRAHFTIIDAYLSRTNFKYSGRSKIVQLLHGKGFKKEGYSKPQLKRQDFIFGPSQFAINLLPDSFKEGSKTFITGYSRNDLFFKQIKDCNIGTSIDILNKIEEIKLKENSKFILYAPTYRRGSPELKLENMLDLDLISEWLEKENIYLLISLHPKYRSQSRKELGNKIIMVPDCDIYPILPKVDLLINDYSSLFSDFLLLNKPIVFFPFDRKDYEEKEGFNIDYDQYAPGPQFYNSQDLIEGLKEIIIDDKLKNNREKIKNFYHTNIDGNSSERISKILLEGIQK